MEATNVLSWHPLSGRSTPVGSKSADMRPGVPEKDHGHASCQTRKQTLRQWLDRWLQLCANRGLRESTVEGYRTTLRLYLDEEVGAKWLASVTTEDINELYTRLLRDGRRDGAGGLSPRTVRYLHTLLSKAFSDAIRAGEIESNPATAADAPSRRATRAPAFEVWSPAELGQFLASAREDPMYVAFRVAAATGVRRGELLGLRWCDVDREAGDLRVVQAVVIVRNVLRITPPKTERSRRAVALDRETAALLEQHRAAVEARTTAFDDHSLVFHDPSGGPIHPALFTYRFVRRVRLAGVRPIRLHDLRHTHATHALQAGVHPKVVSERLGHSTVMITLDTYSHVVPGLQREAAEAVAALVRA